MVGKTLGNYEILAPLGQGGMGEVYRARDTKLDREVAIKVLPEDFAADAERLARFTREAKLLASLNHPNIAGVHGLEDEGDTRFIVMELVEGETLADRIAGAGQMEIDEVLDLARQIATALGAAHDAGVVHRDLKPANVMVKPSGDVKVLDFGLAKAYPTDGSSSSISPDISASPTIMNATRTGVIIGTAAYMSPEQASGGAVDKRADIWAFGVVLYEMLAGGRLFEGESAAYVLADVLRSEPDLDRLPPHAPAEIRRLVRRCLNKRVDQRLHDIADARLVIDEVIAGTDNAGIPELVAEAAGHGIAPARALRPAHAGALSLVVALVAAAFGWWFASRSPAEPPPVRVFEIGTDLYSVSAVTLSPDGEKMVLAGRAQEGLESELYLRRMDDTELAPLPGTIGAGQPFFSPDGNWIGYWGTDEDSGPRSLRKVSLEGASLDIQSFDDLFLFDPHWTVDDTIMFARSAPLRSGLIQVIPAEGGTPTEVVESSDDEASVLGGSLSEPRLLPGGGILLQVARGEFEVMRTDIVVYSPATRVADVLVPDANTPRFVAPSYLFYGRGGSVWMAEYDPYGSPVTGPPTLVLQGVSSSRTSTSYDVAGDGTIAYSPGEFREPSSAPTQRRLVTIDRQGVEQPTGIAATGLGSPRLSPNGRRIAVTRFEDGDTHVWVYDAVTGAEQRTPSVRERNTSPRWSPDGEWVYFDASGEDAAEIYRARPDFPGEAPELLGEGGGTGCWTSRPMGASCSPRRAASTSRFCPSTAKRPRCSSRPIATS